MAAPRYRRIIADQFADGPTPTMQHRRCFSTTVLPNGERQPEGRAVLPGIAMVIGADRPITQEVWFPPDRRPQHSPPVQTFALAGASQAGPIYIADMNALAGRDVGAEWHQDTVAGILLDPRFPLNVLLADGSNVTKGMGLTTNYQGYFVPAATGQRVIMTADETYTNNTGIYQLVRARAA